MHQPSSLLPTQNILALKSETSWFEEEKTDAKEQEEEHHADKKGVSYP